MRTCSTLGAVTLLIVCALVPGHAGAVDGSAAAAMDVPSDGAPAGESPGNLVEEADAIAKTMPPIALEMLLATQAIADCSRQRIAAGRSDGACTCYGTEVADRAGDRDGLVRHAWLVLHGKPRKGTPEDEALAGISAAAAEHCGVGENPLFAAPKERGRGESGA